MNQNFLAYSVLFCAVTAQKNPLDGQKPSFCDTDSTQKKLNNGKENTASGKNFEALPPPCAATRKGKFQLSL